MQEPMDKGSEGSEVEEPGIVNAYNITLDLVQDMVVGPHHLTADAPVALGGTARGPSPHDFLLMAPGSCTSLAFLPRTSRT